MFTPDSRPHAGLVWTVRTLRNDAFQPVGFDELHHLRQRPVGRLRDPNAPFWSHDGFKDFPVLGTGAEALGRFRCGWGYRMRSR